MTITVTSIGEHSWSVDIRESQDGDATTHRVSVSPETIATLGVLDEQAFVREAVAAYLDRGKGTSLPHDVDIDWFEHHVFEHHVDGFLDEVTTRLS